MNQRVAVLVCVTSLLLLISLSGCSSGSTPTQNAATVQVTMSDPATCSGPQGVYSNVFITVTDVKAHTNPSAGPNDSGWIDLTPNLQGAPMQIDLLSAADSTCVLARLGSVSQLPPGNYQQIRIFLLDNSQASALQGPNGCAPQLNAVNCVVLQSDGSKHALQLSSEARTGLKIPSGQIAGGQFTVPSGQAVDINVNIDVNTCSSIIVQGNGVYRLKPVLHAGQLSTTNSSIKGIVLDNQGNPITGGKVIVALEQAGPACSGSCTSGNAPIDRIIMEVVPDSGGNFTFCPVPPGTYDVVAAATGASGGNPVAYAATVTTGVGPGTNIGTIKLIPQPTTLQNPSTAPATIKGTTTTSPANVAEVVSVSPLQSFGTGLFTLPLTVGASTTASVTTSSGTGTYNVSVPAMNPSVGPVNGPYVQDTQTTPSYTIDAIPTACTPSEAQTNTLTTNSPLTVTPGVESDASSIAFTNCSMP